MSDDDEREVARARHSETELLMSVFAEPDGTLGARETAEDGEMYVGEIPATARNPDVVGRWRHFKGGVYEFRAVVQHAPDGPLVLYVDAADDVWLRPWSMVTQTVRPDDQPVPRFVRADE